MAQGSAFRAVLFDWRGTLVQDPPLEWWVRRALHGAGRTADDDTVARLVRGLDDAATRPEVVEAEVGCDCSFERHHAWSLLYFERAGLDEELAHALYAVDLDPQSHPFYPDAAPTLRALHERGVRIALVSDVHVDLRPEFEAAGVGGYFDAFVLSFEHGVQKPDPRIFEIALDALDVDAAGAVMVGDRASHDGGAAAVGIATWLLPGGPGIGEPRPRGLDRVVALVS